MSALDNSLVAVASGMSDLTPPIVVTEDAHLYLRQGDEFDMAGKGILLDLEKYSLKCLMTYK